METRNTHVSLEMRRVYHYPSRCVSLRIEGAPLIGPTNLDWTDLCEELLGVRPQEGELEGSVVKLIAEFPYGTYNFYVTVNSVARMHGDLPCLRIYIERCAASPITKWLRRGNQHIGNDDLRVFLHKLDIMKRHEFVWEPYTATMMAALPPICVVGSVAWFAVVPLICFHVFEWHQPDRVL
ncbi:Serine/threonine-protein phosphatase 7 long form [Glycine max]|nr:Serine/threonine-protein phosphatase 7 long form [Glycine max]